MNSQTNQQTPPYPWYDDRVKDLRQSRAEPQADHEYGAEPQALALVLLPSLYSPTPALPEDTRAGRYNDVSNEDYKLMLDAVKCVSPLWQYKGSPAMICRFERRGQNFADKWRDSGKPRLAFY